HDSVAQEEFLECKLKARFLSELPHAFSLIETLYADARGCRHLDLHLERLSASASRFGFACDVEAVRAALQQASARLEGPTRVRLELGADGRIDIVTAAVTPLSEPVRVLLAPQPVHADDP